MSKVLTTYSTTVQHQLETIGRLEVENGMVRAKDLADALGCRRPTVTGTLRRLARLGLVHYAPYQPVRLTEAGQAVIHGLDHSEKILDEFFSVVLQLPADVAAAEACRLEHLISPLALQRLREFCAFAARSPAGRPTLIAQFARFLARGGESAKAATKKRRKS